MQDLNKTILLAVIISIVICLIGRLFKVGRMMRNERISYEYIDDYNLLQKKLSFGIYKPLPIKGRYIQLYGTVDRPLVITSLKINDIPFPFCSLGVDRIILDKNKPNEYKLIKFDLRYEYDIKKIEINVDPITTKSLKSFKVLIRDHKGFKVWESSDFLAEKPKNVLI
jgi:hypothetical protein